MTTIPTYQYPQVLPDGSAIDVMRRNVATEATAERFGAAQAADVVRFGKTFSEFMMTLAQVRDKALARDSLVRAQRDVNLFLFGNAERQGLYSTAGKDAINSYDLAESEFSDIYKKYIDELPSEIARGMFDASFLPFLSENKRSVLKHQANQIEKYKNETLDAYNQQLVETAINNRNTPEVIAESEAAIAANTAEQFKGMEGPALEVQISGRVSDLYRSVLTAVINDNPKAAKSFFAEYKEKFDPRIRESLQAEVDKKARVFEVYETANMIVSSGLPLEEQLSAVDGITDVVLAADVRKVVKERFREDEEIRKDIQRKAELDTWLNLRNNPLSPIPYGQLDDTQWKAMEKYRNTRLSGFAEVTDWTVMGKLATMTPAELKNIGLENLLKYRSSLEEKHWDTIMSQYVKGVNAEGEGVKSSKLTQIKTVDALIKETAKVMRYTDSQKQDLTRDVQIAVEELELNEGRIATPTEIQKLIDRAILKVNVVTPFWFDFQRPFFETVGELEEKQTYIDNIPTKDLNLIIQALEERNIRVTRENIIRLYKETQ